MAPNKKKQKNGFYFFMQDLQREWAKRGKLVPMGNMAGEAHPLWKELSQEKQDEYTNRAKMFKETARSAEGGKLDSFGVPIEMSRRKVLEAVEKQDRMIANIKKHLDSCKDIFGVSKEPFCIISFNFMCKTEEGVYLPAEVGLIEYSISEGIISEYHAFIDPGPLPEGYKLTCIEESEKTHGIPIENFELATQDYKGIYEQLKTRIGKNVDGRLKYRAYAMSDDLAKVELCLDWLRVKAGEKVENLFEAYDLVHLLVELREVAQNTMRQNVAILPATAREFLTKFTYDYEPNIGCRWHDKEDRSKYCSLGVVKRLGYLLSDHLCEIYAIEFIAGKHLPEQLDETVYFKPSSYKISKPHDQPERAPVKKAPLDQKCSITKGRSVFVDYAESEYVYGAEPGVVSEFPKSSSNTGRDRAIESSRGDHRDGSQWPSAADIVRGIDDDFSFKPDDFPSLDQQGSAERAKGIPHAKQILPSKDISDRNIFEAMKYIGRGRGNFGSGDK